MKYIAVDDKLGGLEVAVGVERPVERHDGLDALAKNIPSFLC